MWGRFISQETPTLPLSSNFLDANLEMLWWGEKRKKKKKTHALSLSISLFLSLSLSPSFFPPAM